MPKKNNNIAENQMDLFRRVEFFSNLDDFTIHHFEKLSTTLTFQPEETIMLSGDIRRNVFFIAKGKARVYWSSKGSRNNILRILSVGDFFGELQVFNESGKSAFSVIAEEECTVIVIKGKEFLNEISNNPKLAIMFAKEISFKLNRAYMQIAALSMTTIKSKIKSCIAQLVEETGIRIPGKNGKTIIKLKNRPTQQQIAEMSGTTRETVNRELSELIKNGYIELSGRDMILLKELPI